jgi:hypothetical protein
VKIQIQNRARTTRRSSTSPCSRLVHVTAESLGEECPDIQGTVVTGSQQVSLPRTLRSKQKLSVWFEVVFSSSCVHDPAKTSARDPGHDDYQYVVTVDHTALDGGADIHPEDDVCPRSVTPPFVTDHYPDGSIKDRGCGRQKPDGTLGDPVTTDVWIRP